MLRAARAVGGEFEAAGTAIAVHQHVEPRLVDRHLAAVEALDARRVDIDADHVVTGLGQAGTGNQPHIARTKDGDFH